MRRVITFICVFSVLVFALCVPVFANSNSMFTLGSVYVRSANDLQWYDATSYTTYNPSATAWTVQTWRPDTFEGNMLGIRIALVPYGYVQVESGYYYNFTFDFSADIPISSSLEGYDPDFSLTFHLSDGTSKTIRPYSTALRSVPDSTDARWESRFALYVGDGVPVRVDGIVFETLYAGRSGANYRVLIDSSVTVEPTPELKRHLEMMQKLQEIFTGLSDEIQEQTEELTNGWDNTGDQPADVGGVTDDLGQAESEALGGKTDAEIQQEVNNALSGEGLPDFETSFVIADLFDRLLWSFGSGYQSLLILSLTLGLAAFLIGRSWSKGV